LIAATFLAVSFSNAQFSLFPKEDHWVLFFVLAAFYFALRFNMQQRPMWLWLSAIACGLSIGSKVSIAPIVIAPVWAIMVAQGEHDGQVVAKPTLRARVLKIALCLGIALATFLVVNPVYVLNFSLVFDNYKYLLSFMNISVFGVKLAAATPDPNQAIWHSFVTLAKSAATLTEYQYLDWAALAIGYYLLIRRTAFGWALLLFNLCLLASLSFYGHSGFRFLLPIVATNAAVFSISFVSMLEATSNKIQNISILKFASAVALIFLGGSMVLSNAKAYMQCARAYESCPKTAEWIIDKIPFGSKFLSNVFLACAINPNAYNVQTIWFLSLPRYQPVTNQDFLDYDYVGVSSRELKETYSDSSAVYDYLFEKFNAVGEVKVASFQETAGPHHIYQNRSSDKIHDAPPFAGYRRLKDHYTDEIFSQGFASFRNGFLEHAYPSSNTEPEGLAINFSAQPQVDRKISLLPGQYPLSFFSFVTRDNNYDKMLKSKDVATAASVVPFSVLRERPSLRLGYDIVNPEAADHLDLVVDGESAEGVNLGRVLYRIYHRTQAHGYGRPLSENSGAATKGALDLNILADLTKQSLRPDDIRFVRLSFHAYREAKPPNRESRLFCVLTGARLEADNLR
jgi:hypothetical protein